MRCNRMVVLTEYDTISQAEVAKARLDSEGIWTMINNEYMSTIYPTGIMPAQIVVMEMDFERARKILAEFVESETTTE